MLGVMQLKMHQLDLLLGKMIHGIYHTRTFQLDVT